MKNLISALVAFAFLFSIQSNAQEQKPVQNKKKAKTEKSCSTEDKKSCSTEDKKSCCSEGKSEKKEACCSSKKGKETKS